jgi:hypothetical protein
VIRRRHADHDRAAVAPTHPHCLLLSLPPRLVITTNYDDLLERTLTAPRRQSSAGLAVVPEGR